MVSTSGFYGLHHFQLMQRQRENIFRTILGQESPSSFSDDFLTDRGRFTPVKSNTGILQESSVTGLQSERRVEGWK